MFCLVAVLLIVCTSVANAGKPTPTPKPTATPKPTPNPDPNYTRTASNTAGTADQWSAGTNWDAVPASGTAAQLVFGGSVPASLAAGATIFTNNDIAGNFQLNILNFTYAGPASGVQPTVTVSGNPLQFVSNGATTPTMSIAGTGSVKPLLIISNNIVLTNNLSITATSDGSLSGVISGTGSLTKTGGGTLTLSGNNTYTTGGTNINGGILNLGSAQTGTGGPLGGTGTVASVGTIKFGSGGVGGTLQYSAANQTDYSSRFSGAAGQTFKVDTNGQTVTWASALVSGGGSFTKLGVGTLNITSGASSYDGAATIDGGTLNLSSNTAALANINTNSSIGKGSVAGSAADLVFGGGTLSYTRTTAATPTSTNRLFTIGDANGLTATLDSSSTTFANTMSFTGTGALAFGGSGARILTLTGTNTSGNNMFAPIIGNGTGGATSVVKNGVGHWVLTGANTYTGGTTVNDGTLELNAFGNPGATIGAATGSLTVNGGTFDMETSASVGNLTGTGGTILNNTGANVTLTIGNGGGGGGNYQGIIANNNGFASGTLALTKTEAGTITLSGPNTFTGGVNLNGGTLALGSAGAIGSSGTISWGGGTLQYSASNTTDYSSRSSNLADQVIRIDTNGQSVTWASNLTSTGGSLTKFGNGTLTLSGTNSYNFRTTISGGTISASLLANGGVASNIGAIGNGASSLVFDGGTLKYTGVAVSTDHLFSVGTSGGTIDASGSGAVNFSNTGAMGFNSQSGTRNVTLTGTNNGSNTLAATIGDNGGATTLIKNGAGTWTLTGNSTFSGGVVLNTGQLNINSATGIGTGTFEIGDVSTTIDNTSAGAITLTNNNDFLLDGGDLTFTGTKNLNLGTGNFTLDGANRTVTVTNSGATLTIGGVVGNPVGQNRFLTKDGSGTLVLNGTNTYSGGTIIRQGALVVSDLENGNVASSLGKSFSLADNLVLGGGGSLSSATLLYIGSGSSTNRLFTLDTGTNIFDSSGAGALNFTNSGAILFSGAAGNRSLTLTGSNAGENTLTPTFVDPSGGVFALLKTGSGTWSMTNGSNSYTGTTFIGDGTLGFDNGALGTGLINFTNPNPSPGGAILRWNSGNTQDVSSRIKINDGVTATMNTNGNDVTFASALQTQSVNGSGALTKIGAGTLTLSAANTYSGGTNVNGGTLLANNASGSGTGSGAVMVNSTGTLGGTGTISGAVTVNSGGTLAPGSSPGILHTGSLTLNSSSTYLLDLNGGSGPTGTGAGTLYDQTVVTGTITLGGNLSVVIGATPLNIGDKFFIALNDGTDLVSGTFANTTGGGAIYSQAGDVFLVNYLDNGDTGTIGNDVSLTVTAVPEPGTWIGGALALGAFAFSQRRRFSLTRAQT